MSGDLVVAVACFDYDGNPTAANFTVTVTQPRSAVHGVLDYDWVYKTTGSGLLTGRYQYNSAGRRNRVRHLHTGRYRLILPGPRSRGTAGIVKVTPIGLAPGNCEPVSWHGTVSGEVVNVDCFSASRHFQNREFSVAYARGTSLLGQNGLDAATAFASRPGTGLYQPADQYNSHRGARVAVSLQAGRGDYLILLPGSEGPAGHPNGGGGDVQVSAVGSNDDHCVIDRWTQQFTPAVEVHCYSNAGAPANTAFTIQWIVA